MFGSTARYKWLTKPLILPCTVRLMSKWKWHDPSSKCKEWVRLYCSPHPCCCCSWLLNKMVPVEKQSKGWKSLNLFQMSLMRLHLSPHNLTYMITGVSTLITWGSWSKIRFLPHMENLMLMFAEVLVSVGACKAELCTMEVQHFFPILCRRCRPNILSQWEREKGHVIGLLVSLWYWGK